MTQKWCLRRQHGIVNRLYTERLTRATNCILRKSQFNGRFQLVCSRLSFDPDNEELVVSFERWPWGRHSTRTCKKWLFIFAKYRTEPRVGFRLLVLACVPAFAETHRAIFALRNKSSWKQLTSFLPEAVQSQKLTANDAIHCQTKWRRWDVDKWPVSRRLARLKNNFYWFLHMSGPDLHEKLHNYYVHQQSCTIHESFINCIAACSFAQWSFVMK